MTTATTASEREELSNLIGALPDDKLAIALDFMERLVYGEDDEPLTEEELKQIEASRADIAAGRVYTLEEVERRLARLP
jgi:predicted transcriptional regulator